ncbi:MAG TPA: TVP38/TMEM64 family protein [Syntrophomonadaceae bacterium]|nr:TVP38/TMEM64 family protein [Syntrophomonadaceae bacterium]
MDIALEGVPELVQYIRGLGLIAPIFTFVLFAVQAALPIFPYILLAAAGGIIFGFKLGLFLAWSGALAGACLAYWICRIIGYQRLSDYLERRWQYRIPALNPSASFWTIVAARVIPIIPTPLINLVAAVSGVPFWTFFTSSAIGKIPTAVLYTGLGLAFFSVKDIETILYLLGGLILLVALLRYLARRYTRYLMRSPHSS